ncbi:hypothetical protein VNO78_31794 [Psophocarpus tetragonolobus]|uniref:Uncharacterized protein n=1 Tax=Psophocarpus tetragonolobus TaxID=3891 RepID=A0AAN9RZ47_PSOTE
MVVDLNSIEERHLNPIEEGHDLSHSHPIVDVQDADFDILAQSRKSLGLGNDASQQFVGASIAKSRDDKQQQYEGVTSSLSQCNNLYLFHAIFLELSATPLVAMIIPLGMMQMTPPL